MSQDLGLTSGRGRIQGRRAAPRPGVVLVVVMAICFSAVAGCRESSPSFTGLRIVTTWGPPLAPEQLEYALMDGTQPVAMPAVRPGQANGPLASGVDVVMYLRPDLAGKELRCRVRAVVRGRALASADAPVTVEGGRLVEVTVALSGGGDGGASDGPADAGDDADGPPGGKANGQACATGADCRSKNCVDGICCNTPCVGVCVSCGVPGSEGVCSPMPIGSQDGRCAQTPVETCGFDGTCDGKGACRKYPAGVRCSPGMCAGSSISSAGACNGLGACEPGPVITCAPFLCSTEMGTPSCRATCSSDNHCVPGRRCESGSCGKKIDGAVCMTGTECQSGNCVDGVCCNTACDGACYTCNLPGMAGQCQPVVAGLKDPRGLCADEGVATCGTDGTCDGRGGCARYPSGAVCKPAACSSTTGLIPPSRCDGRGACAPASEVPCAPFVCRSGACTVSCQTSQDCAPGAMCDANGSCGTRRIGQPCTDAGQCGSGFCVDGVCCAEACTGPCRSCATGPQIGTCVLTNAGGSDPRGQCRDQGVAGCGTDGRCDGAGACRKYLAGSVCSPGSCTVATNQRRLASTCDGQGACLPGATASCAPYRCNGPTCFTACGSNADCASPNVCIGGTCGLRPNGVACTSNGECTSGNCIDGVCCQAMTCGPCTACNVAGSLGTCAPVAAGAPDPRGTCTAQPASTCGTDGTCNGAGACRRHPAGTVCGMAACQSDGVSLALAPACDGQGMCVPGAIQPCAPFACNSTARTCRTTCGGDVDCAAPNLCGPGGQCGNLKPLGQFCAAGTECASGYCVDGVCCGSASCSSCRACNVAGSAGSCAPVAAGFADPRGVCSTEAAATCGYDGKCDGAGSCRRHPPGTICAAGTCSGNTATPPSACDGAGTCVPPPSQLDCSPYKCGGAVCLTTCNTDTDCVSPLSCIGSTCQLRPLGTGCESGAQCASGKCTDGVCCQVDSCGSCRACNVATSLGVCKEVPDGAPDPSGMCATEAASTCKQDGKCDGAGNCRLYPAGTVCVPASCMGRHVIKADICDGQGTCVDQGSTSCSPYTCDTATVACFTSCQNNNQCSGGRECQSGQCD